MKNKFVIEDKIVKIYYLDETYFIIDIEDLELVSKYTWGKRDGGYPYYRTVKGSLHLHRLFFTYNMGLCIDHINRDTSDNRRCNLRLVDYSTNTYNRTYIPNKSGYKGVYKRSDRDGWQVQIWRKGKCHYLGTYKNIDDAIKARKDGELKLYGFNL